MTEILFILTTIFVAYVIYTLAEGQKNADKPAPLKKMPTPPVTAKKPDGAVAQTAVAAPKPSAVASQPAAPVAPVAPEPETAKPEVVETAVAAPEPPVAASQPVIAEPAAPATETAKPDVVAVEPAVAAAPEEAPVAASQPVAEEPVTPTPEPVAAKPAVVKNTVRNPKTGEVATVNNNYRFTKRWIKEALVTEGLLDKVYKNNELDSAAEARIKTALASLMDMDSYRA